MSKAGFQVFHAWRKAVIGLLTVVWGQMALAQTTPPVINVAGANGTVFNSWLKADGTPFLDPVKDNQTGLMRADFMGIAAGATGFSSVPTSNVASTLMAAGTIGGADSLVFRYRMTDTSSQTYLGSSVSVGISFKDLVLAPTDPLYKLIQIYVTIDSTNKGTVLFFQGGGSGANDGPNTTTVDAGAFAATVNADANATNNVYTQAAPLTLTSGTNWSYQAVTAVGETNYDRTATNGTDINQYVTFAVKFSDLNNAVRAITGNTSFSMGYTSEMAFVGWSSTQVQAINQDVNGLTGLPVAGAGTWSSLGAFTEYVEASGLKKPIPEASTVAQVGALLLIGLAGGYYRRRKSVAPVRATGAIN